MKRQFGILCVALAVAGATGCSSATKVKYGKFSTGGHAAVVKKPAFYAQKADEGFGFKLGLGYVELGATTVHNPDAKLLSLGIESSTGFDGEEGTLVTSATRVGSLPVGVGGALALGFKRVTLNGSAEIGPCSGQALYADHFTGATAKYVPFPALTHPEKPDALRTATGLTFGSLDLGGLVDLHDWRGFAAGQGKLTLGFVTLGGTAKYGDCSQGIGQSFRCGLVDSAAPKAVIVAN
jgi:hypothetical protein